MIFTKVDALVKDIDVDKYHIETVILSSDDLNKKIIRVKSDHGNEFGIRLDKGQKLQNGSAFFIDDHHVLAIGVESQDLMSSHLKIWMKWESQLTFLGILINRLR